MERRIKSVSQIQKWEGKRGIHKIEWEQPF